MVSEDTVKLYQLNAGIVRCLPNDACVSSAGIDIFELKKFKFFFTYVNVVCVQFYIEIEPPRTLIDCYALKWLGICFGNSFGRRSPKLLKTVYIYIVTVLIKLKVICHICYNIRIFQALESKYERLRKTVLLMSLKEQMDWRRFVPFTLKVDIYTRVESEGI